MAAKSTSFDSFVGMGLFKVYCFSFASILTAALVLRHETRNSDFGVVSEAKAVNTIGGLEPSGRDKCGLVVTRNNGSVD